MCTIRPSRGPWLLTALALLPAACSVPTDKTAIAQVGTARLSLAEIHISMPMEQAGQDSVGYIRQYVDEWVDTQLLYEQGLRSLPNLDEIEMMVEEYRRRLVAQRYETELLRERLGEVSDEDCALYYEEHAASLRLSEPVVQYLWVRLPVRSARLDFVRGVMKQLGSGDYDDLELLENYCAQHAIEFDNALMQWMPLTRLAGRMPQLSPTEPTRRLQEIKEGDDVILYILRDYRAAGDEAPYECALRDIRELLAQQRRADFHNRLLQDLRREGERSGFVKINLKTEQ